MDLSKCKTCVNYDSFFGSCDLWIEEVYLGEGEEELRPARISSVDEKMCNYERRAGNNDRQKNNRY